ncbi:MAG: ABC transporter ATP-binding protein, partial [Thermoanaerobaculia bacterium]
MSSRIPGGESRRGGAKEAGPEGKKKALPFRVVLGDAIELVSANRGRLVLGLSILLVNRLSGLVLPGTTRWLLDDVIGKGRRDLLPLLLGAAAGATLIQAVTGFSLSQVLGKAAQRSITQMRRHVQRHVTKLPIAYFDQTKTGVLLSRVMTDAEGIRNLVGTGLVEVVGGLITAVFALVLLFNLNAKLTAIALSVLSLFGLV